jgi:integrase/recombinase XerC
MSELAFSPKSPMVVVDAAGLLAAFFQGRSKGTLKAYRRDLAAFHEFVGASSLEEAARLLLGKNQGQANALALSYKAELVKEGLSAATVNRRLAALRSLVKMARLVGLCAFTLEVESLEVEAMRDTTGPGQEGVKNLLALVQNRKDLKGRRDLALLRLLFDLALRRGEVVSLDLEHVELEQRALFVLGKGRTGRARITLPEVTRDGLAAWLKVRGNEPGPLFFALDAHSYGVRLTGDGVCKIIKALGKKAGLRVRPHGLRHAAITQALNATGGDIRKVQKFSRHKSLDMLLLYDDAREDFAGEVAALVSKSTR